MKKLLFLSLLTLASISANTQSIPSGKYGIQDNYDNAGNLISREYACMPAKNGGSLGAPILVNPGAVLDCQVSHVIKEIEAIYPNPTTGKFVIRCSTPLTSGLIFILIIERSKR